jgi:hypothetical protein
LAANKFAESLLYGVIHHSRASFGIIVSRGGFTKGAVEFARDKPIYFLDVSHLIAMQEGRDVLAEAFTPRGTANWLYAAGNRLQNGV